MHESHPESSAFGVFFICSCKPPAAFVWRYRRRDDRKGRPYAENFWTREKNLYVGGSLLGDPFGNVAISPEAAEMELDRVGATLAVDPRIIF